MVCMNDIISYNIDYYTGQEEVPPDLVGAVTQFGQSPFGQGIFITTACVHL